MQHSVAGRGYVALLFLAVHAGLLSVKRSTPNELTNQCRTYGIPNNTTLQNFSRLRPRPTNDRYPFQLLETDAVACYLHATGLNPTSQCMVHNAGMTTSQLHNAHQSIQHLRSSIAEQIISCGGNAALVILQGITVSGTTPGCRT